MTGKTVFLRTWEDVLDGVTALLLFRCGVNEGLLLLPLMGLLTLIPHKLKDHFMRLCEVKCFYFSFGFKHHKRCSSAALRSHLFHLNIIGMFMLYLLF